MHRPRRLLVLLALAIVPHVAPQPACAAPPPTVRVTLRSGEQAVYACPGLDAKHLVFRFQVGKRSLEVPIGAVAVLEFGAAGGGGGARAESLDVAALADGRQVRGVLRKFDGKRLTLLLPAGGESQVAVGSVRRLTLGDGLVDVDRREFGTGFSLIGPEAEVSLAAGYASDVTAGSPVVHDDAVTAYVTALGKRIAARSKRPGLDYSFTVIDSKTVNAFTVGGGHVFVYRGLVEQMSNEAELAGVLAHEIGHNVGRHTAKQLSSTLLMQGVVSAGGQLLSGGDARRRQALESAGGSVAYFTNLKFSRDDEREADYLAVYNLHALGYDPHAMVTAFETLKRNQGRDPGAFEVFFQTHPSLDERIANTGTELPKLHLDHPRLDTPEFRTMRARLTGLPRPTLRKNLQKESVRVAAGGFAAYALTLDPNAMHGAALRGHVATTSGDIRVMVMDSTSFANWKAGRQAPTTWISGRVGTADMNVPLATAGPWFVVFDNTFAAVEKAVSIEDWIEYRE